MAKVFGRSFIDIDGVRLATVPGSGKLKIGKVTRKAVIADTGFVGTSEETMNGEITCDIVIDSNTNLDKIADTTDATVTYTMDSGQQYTIKNAACSEQIEVQSGEGKATITFVGSSSESDS